MTVCRSTYFLDRFIIFEFFKRGVDFSETELSNKLKSKVFPIKQRK